MKTTINGVEVEGTPEEISKLLGIKQNEYYGIDMNSDIPKPCRACPNHPSNGGSGICHCTLGLSDFT